MNNNSTEKETVDRASPSRRQNSTMFPADRHKILAEMLARDRESAWMIAHYERAQRDEYTSKLRFGLAALNSVSMATVLNLGGIMGKIEPVFIVMSALFFFAGTVLAGYSLLAHQTHLIELTGTTSVRALSIDRAVSLSAFPLGSEENDRLGEAIEEAAENGRKTYGFAEGALKLQWWSGSTWLGGVTALAAAKIISLLPTWSEVSSWFWLLVHRPV